MQKLRLVFAGTPAAAVPSLERLAAGPHDVVGVVTRPAAPLGRKRVLTPSPGGPGGGAAGTARDRGGPARRRRDGARSQRSEPDLGVIVAYGGLVREPLLSTPGHGWINLHFSLLPAWRGAAPVQHALIAGDAQTGASVFRLVPELDAGDVFATSAPSDRPRTTRPVQLLDALAVRGADLLAEVVDGIAAGTAVAVPQAGEPTLRAEALASTTHASTGRGRPTRCCARFRGVTPEPGAWTTFDDARLKVLELSAANDGEPALAPGAIARLGPAASSSARAPSPLELGRVQPAGRTPMPAVDWWRGAGRDAAVAG